MVEFGDPNDYGDEQSGKLGEAMAKSKHEQLIKEYEMLLTSTCASSLPLRVLRYRAFRHTVDGMQTNLVGMTAFSRFPPARVRLHPQVGLATALLR